MFDKGKCWYVIGDEIRWVSYSQNIFWIFEEDIFVVVKKSRSLKKKTIAALFKSNGIVQFVKFDLHITVTNQWCTEQR